MSPLTLHDLVRNRTMSAGMAATLAAAAAERRSFLVVAVPRLAGKTTTLDATLQHVPEGTPVHTLARLAVDLGIPPVGDGGYLRVAEVAPTGFDDYLWGADTRRAFEALERGFSLATSLHAGSIEDAFAVLCRQNGVPDALAARLQLVVVIEVLGPWTNPQRRVVAAVHEVHGVSGGRPDARLLHRWDAATDSFEEGDAPLFVGNELGDRASRVRAFQASG